MINTKIPLKHKEKCQFLFLAEERKVRVLVIVYQYEKLIKTTHFGFPTFVFKLL